MLEETSAQYGPGNGLVSKFIISKLKIAWFNERWGLYERYVVPRVLMAKAVHYD